jgi:hypothetical protein
MARKISIELGREAMLKEAKDGVHANYIPTLKGHALKEEGGVTEISIKNLQAVARVYGKPLAIEMTETPDRERLFLFHFPSHDHKPYIYLATGFSIGYAGEGPNGLARIMADFRFGEFETLRADIIRGEWQAGVVAINGGLIRHLCNMITADEGMYENVL